MCNYNFNCHIIQEEIWISFIQISYRQSNNLEQESYFYYVCYNPQDEPHLADLCFHARSLQIPIAEINQRIKPMGYASDGKDIYKDDLVQDYYTDSVYIGLQDLKSRLRPLHKQI